MEVYLYRPSTFCVLFDTPQSAPFYDAFSPIVPQSCACKAEIWTVLSSSSSSGVWDWRWNQQTHSLQTKFNSPKADYQSSVRCFFSHSWSLCKKLILEVLEKVSELFFGGGRGGYFPFALQICEGLISKLFICNPPDLPRSVTGNWYHQFCCQTFPSKR